MPKMLAEKMIMSTKEIIYNFLVPTKYLLYIVWSSAAFKPAYNLRNIAALQPDILHLWLNSMVITHGAQNVIEGLTP